jgi:hypothetical protein
LKRQRYKGTGKIPALQSLFKGNFWGKLAENREIEMNNVSLYPKNSDRFIEDDFIGKMFER